MAATVHIPLSEMESALERARAGDSVVLDVEGEEFSLERLKQDPQRSPFMDIGPIHIERTDFRPLSEILADPNVKWSEALMDDQWASDMEAIVKENRSHDRDLWTE